MNKQHECDNVIWTGEEWVLEVEHEYQVSIEFCPFCGKQLSI